MAGSVTSMLPELGGREKKLMYYAKALDRDTYPFLFPYSPKPAILQHYMIKITDTM